jgi:hypothetical protein
MHLMAFGRRIRMILNEFLSGEHGTICDFPADDRFLLWARKHCTLLTPSLRHCFRIARITNTFFSKSMSVGMAKVPNYGIFKV